MENTNSNKYWGDNLKRLGIVTSNIDVGNEYKRQLQKIFGEAVDIVTYSFLATKEIIEDIDVLLISTYSQFEVLKKYIPEDVEVVISNLTFSKDGYNKLRSSDFEKKVALVNLSFEMCIETIATLYQLGFDDYELIPVYPNMEKIPNINYAVTTGELRHVPNQIQNVIDLGHRLIDKNTMVDLAIALNLEEVLTEPPVLEYFNNLMSFNKGYEYFISQSKAAKNQINMLLSIMAKGVISFNKDGVIETFNDNAKQMINIKDDQVGSQISDILPKDIIEEYHTIKEPIKNKLLYINEKNITVSIFPILDLYNEDSQNLLSGSYAILESFELQEDTQNKLRLQLSDKGHIARYNINNIIGDSDAIRHVRELVVRMGNSKSVVLITGESGTGKELIAQAIHNASPIKDKQFVAINCAALSANLLESELFGYEAGAFTGASKNGKAGIFELAHNGTLFLDEIGEMPLELQVRLLRVIQEKEVMRVGGNKVIKVNVRLVAATNRDLYEEVRKGNFRKDLYYRLNVLPINVPPLRERGEDILLLMEYFKKIGNCNFELTDEVSSFLTNYSWEGNIRELRNCVEYFDNIGSTSIHLDQLPFHMKHEQISIEKEESKTYGHLSDNESYILKTFYEAFKARKKLGRKSLSEKAFEDNMFLSEYDIRKILYTLRDYEYINVEGGRGGSTISKKGIELVENNKN
jgi:transcriptional regulator with PAS, ATPase and Fis domain